MNLAFFWGGTGLCIALAGCTAPPRDVVEIAAPLASAQFPQEPSPPAAVTPAIAETAVIRKRRIPAYPAALSKEGVEGQVIAVFYVGAEGRAEEVRIERSPHPLLSKAVTDALKEWRFDPARSADGPPVRTRMRLPFSFQIE